MKVRAIIPFMTARGEIPAGSILNIPDHLLAELAGKVEPLVDISPFHCQSRKVGGRICGAPLRTGINGFLSCSEPGCQVPATPHGLKRRGGKNR